MRFTSQAGAKRYLVETIALESQKQGEPLSDLDRRLLLFSVDEPASAEGIPDEVLEGFDPDFEQKYSKLLRTAYNEADQGTRETIADAIRELKKGDHYITVIASSTLARATRIRDLTIYVAVGIAVVAMAIFYAMR
jgi:hypothetical protein